MVTDVDLLNLSDKELDELQESSDDENLIKALIDERLRRNGLENSTC